MPSIGCKRQISFQTTVAKAALRNKTYSLSLDQENLDIRLVLTFNDLEFWAFTPTREYANFTFKSNHILNYER